MEYRSAASSVMNDDDDFVTGKEARSPTRCSTVQDVNYTILKQALTAYGPSPLRTAAVVLARKGRHVPERPRVKRSRE